MCSLTEKSCFLTYIFPSGALIVVDVHARDVIERLIQAKVSRTDDFEWISMMRFYMAQSNEEPNEKTVNIQMIATTLEYGFEYIGNQGRLVVSWIYKLCYQIGCLFTFCLSIYFFLGDSIDRKSI